MAQHGATDDVTGFRVPQAHLAVFARRGEFFAIGWPGDAQDPMGVTLTRELGQFGAQVPEPNRFVTGTTGQVSEIVDE